jgi:hypothetical protein
LTGITTVTSSSASHIVVGFRGMPVVRTWHVGVLESLNSNRSIVGRRHLARIRQIAWSHYLFWWLMGWLATMRLPFRSQTGREIGEPCDTVLVSQRIQTRCPHTVRPRLSAPAMPGNPHATGTVIPREQVSRMRNIAGIVPRFA